MQQFFKVTQNGKPQNTKANVFNYVFVFLYAFLSKQLFLELNDDTFACVFLICLTFCIQKMVCFSFGYFPLFSFQKGFTLYFPLRFENHRRGFDSVCQEDGKCYDFDSFRTGCICPHRPAAVHGKSTPQVHPLAHSQQHHLWWLQLHHGQWNNPQRHRYIQFQSIHRQWRWRQVKVIKYFQFWLSYVVT